MFICFPNKMLGTLKDRLINLVLILLLVELVHSKDLHLKENDEVSANSEEIKRDAPQYYNEILRHSRYARHLDGVTESAMGHVFNKMRPNVLNNFFKRLANKYTLERRKKIEKKKRMMKKKDTKNATKKTGKRKKSKKWFEDAASNVPKKTERKYRNKRIKFAQKQEDKEDKLNIEAESKGSEYVL